MESIYLAICSANPLLSIDNVINTRCAYMYMIRYKSPVWNIFAVAIRKVHWPDQASILDFIGTLTVNISFRPVCQNLATLLAQSPKSQIASV